MQGNSIRQLVESIANKNMPEIIVGVVASTNPVKIIQKDDIGIQLSRVSLIIPSGKPALSVGDEWYLLAVSNKKVFYLLDKV